MAVIEYPEPMARFECNLKGCCCKAWGIPFQPPDLRRLIATMGDDELNDVLRGATFSNDGDGRMVSFELRKEPPDSRCLFLADDLRCGLQVERGEDTLPTLCRSFPAGAVELAGVRELIWDGCCPEVMEQIAESDDPIEIVRADLDDQHPLAVRARLGFATPKLRLRDQPLDVEGLLHIRGRLLEAFNEREQTLTATLSAVNWALWRVGQGTMAAEAFELRDDPVEPFAAYFDMCVKAHDARVLVVRTADYERFIHAVDVTDVKWLALSSAFEARDDWDRVIDPDDAELAPLVFRYLANRAWAPFGLSYYRAEADLAFGALTHYVATGIRIAIGLIEGLGLEDRRVALKVGLGASEYFYRGLRHMPPAVMPWFQPDG